MAKYLFEIEGIILGERSLFKGSCIAKDVPEVFQLFDECEYLIYHIKKVSEKSNYSKSGILRVEVLGKKNTQNIVSGVKHSYIIEGSDGVLGGRSIKGLCIALSIIEATYMMLEKSFTISSITEGCMADRRCECSIVNIEYIN